MLHRLIATGCFVGYFPVAPGSVASLLVVFLYGIYPGTALTHRLIAILILFFLGVWSATQVERHTERDAQIIVIDEVVGMLIAVAFVEKTFKWLAFGFILFRFFDIIKLYPARSSERLPGGWGVMIDDVIAGAYAAGVMALTNGLIAWLK